MIWLPTIRISLGPYKNKPKLMPKAPIIITQFGINALAVMVPISTLCKIAASGPIALATSFAPCANDSKAAEQIKGILNKVLKERFLFSIPSDWRFMSGFIISQTKINVMIPTNATISNSGFHMRFSPLIER